MFAAEAPKEERLRWIVNRSIQNYRQLQVLARSMGINRETDLDVQEVTALCLDAITGTPSTSKYNARLISTLANIIWGYDTLFIPYSELLPYFADSISALLDDEPMIRSDYNRYANETGSLPPPLPPHGMFWLICSNCQRRYPPLSVQDAKPACPDCGVRGPDPRASIKNLVEDKCLTPRVLIDDILFTIELPAVLAISYIGSADHIAAAGALNARYLTTQPHLLWRPRPVRFSLAELTAIRRLGKGDNPPSLRCLQLSLTGRGSLLYSLLDSAANSTRESWARHWARNPSFSGICISTKPTYISADESLFTRLVGAAANVER